MDYVDGFVVPVPKSKRNDYIALAKKAALIFKEYGALQVVECWADDVPEGKVTSFPMSVQCQEDEIVVFSWIVWPSKKVRDEGMKKTMEDPRLQCSNDPMPFDGKRLIYGGFKKIVDM